jgi:NTP pyrophosphatase (non-canonical NTP hydrolase)
MSIIRDEALLKTVLEFRAARDWNKFHTLRTLSMALTVEAAELAEITQWTPDADLAQRLEEVRGKVEEEIADICILLTYLTYDLDIDVDDIVKKKLLVNGMKYPVDQFKGSFRKYNEKLS